MHPPVPSRLLALCLTAWGSTAWTWPHAQPCSPGKTLLKVSEAEKRLGAAERDFIHTASVSFLTPLRNFLEGDWKTISVRTLSPRRGPGTPGPSYLEVAPAS